MFDTIIKNQISRTEELISQINNEDTNISDIRSELVYILNEYMEYKALGYLTHVKRCVNLQEPECVFDADNGYGSIEKYVCPECCHLLTEDDVEAGYCKWCGKSIYKTHGIERENDMKNNNCIINADKIRSMTDEELAKFITNQFCNGIGENLILDWLRQPAE